MMGGNFNDWKGLNWQNAETYKRVVKAYKNLIALRRNMGGVSAGLVGRAMNLYHVNENDKVVAYHRWQKGGSKDDVIVVVNFGNRSFTNYTIGFPHNGKWRVRFCSSDKIYGEDFAGIRIPDIEVRAGNGAFILPASTALVFSQD